MKKSGAVAFWACVVAVPVCERIFPGVHAASLLDSVVCGVVLGLAYLLIRPVLRFFTAPIGCITLGLFGMVIDTALVLGCSSLIKGFAVSGFWWAAAVALTVNAMCVPITMLGVGQK